ncbi:MAG: hypothetical protein FWC47_02900 [Oscillospiraceae bacterium]|nr:hypothetical protein [Oscillospiraceae bacterium]
MEENIMGKNIHDRIQKLIDKGVIIIDPRQTFIAEEVNLDRVFKGSTLFPGTRLTGKRTLIGSCAKIGTEGPATIDDSIIASHAEVASGFLSESTLLSHSHAGANSHFRSGTLLEEEAFTAHSVGLKQSILMYSVTLGSLINLCDVLVSGGRSRSDHTEIGSGFIHFNFTPWGKNGDKATPSLIGNVTEGLFLDQERIFLGGLSGIVGPRSIGFGAMTVAGQVIREPVAGSTMHSEVGSRLDKSWSASKVKFSDKRLKSIHDQNIEFISQLYALKEWYTHVRMKRSHLQRDSELPLVLTGAIETIQTCIHERVIRYNSFAKEWSLPLIDEICLSKDSIDTEFSLDWKLDLNYTKWIKELTEDEKQKLHHWLNNCVKELKNTLLVV